ncbi:pentapeptide repeat-containing protein [Pseudonocardia xishanensis]
MTVVVICLAVALVVIGLAWAAGRQHGRRGMAAGQSAITADDVLIMQARQLHAAEISSRLPALTALEQHAQATPWHRAAVVETLTGYLRCAPSGDETVRRAVQRTLSAHASPAHGDAYWGELDLDLDGAELTDLDLSGAVVRRISARRAQLRGDTRMTALRARDSVLLSGATLYGDMHCDDMIVEHRTDMALTTFKGAFSADGCALHGGTVLSGATFCGPASFADTIFFDSVALSDPRSGPAAFRGKTSFARARFTAARLDHVGFPAGVDLEDTRFIRTPATPTTAVAVLHALGRQR